LARDSIVEAMTTMIGMAPNGRLVVPAALRRRLGVEGESAAFLADVVNGKLVLVAADVVPRAERDWLESEGVTRLIEAAEENIDQGKTRPLTRAGMQEIRQSRTVGDK